MKRLELHFEDDLTRTRRSPATVVRYDAMRLCRWYGGTVLQQFVEHIFSNGSKPTHRTLSNSHPTPSRDYAPVGRPFRCIAFVVRK